MSINISENQMRFESIFNAYIKKNGAAALLNWIKSTDFFSAPASSRFHLDEAGGLCEHSLNVYGNLIALVQKWKEMYPAEAKLMAISAEDIAICGLLHDLCKIDFYKIDYRNVKNAYGTWEKVPYYGIEEKFPMGHGEKSVYLINKYMQLTDDQALAINWHMGGFDKRVQGGEMSISKAYEMSPLAALLQSADFLASYIGEKRNS